MSPDRLTDPEPSTLPHLAKRHTAVGRALPFAWATVAVAIAGTVAAAVERLLPLPNLSLVFLTAVLLCGVRLGTAPALYAAGLGLAVYNFFFTVPRYTFSVHDRADVLTLLFFVLVAVLTGNLAGLARRQVEELRESAARAANLYDFSRSVAAAIGVDEVVRAIARHASLTFAARALVFLPATGDPESLTGHPPVAATAVDDLGAARRAWREGAAQGAASHVTADSTYLFALLPSGDTAIGLVGLVLPPGRAGLSDEQRLLFEALAVQSAVAIERARLTADMERTRVLAEAESFRAALLSSISHDLRTPLASIVGSATTLAAVWEGLAPTDRRDLTDTILEQSNRLNGLVQNLLDMTRIEHGHLQPRRDWADLREVVGRAVYRLRETLGHFQTTVAIGEDVPLLHLDPVLMEQVFVNILDNAAKHAPAGSAIDVTATLHGDAVEVRVEDEGPGIPAGDRDRVFDMFFRAGPTGGPSAGTGLGLAICKGFVEAHGGQIAAAAAARGGAAIVITLPLAEAGSEREGRDDGR